MTLEENDEQVLKRVTIRGVDSKLYDQVINLAPSTVLSMGELLTHVIQHATKGEKSKRFMRRHRFRMNLPKKFDSKLEIIEHLDEITVSKDDLISAGPNTVYAFLRIKNLIFSDDVDSETILNHVIFISKCPNVKMSKNIPKLIASGLIRKKRRYKTTDNTVLKDITIRNVSKLDYHEFVAKAKREEKTVGELLNEILANMVPNFEIQHILHDQNEPESLVVSDLDKLTVTTHGLEELGHRKVLFYNINNLKFENNIPTELFQDKVIGMHRCSNTTRPSNIPDLLWLARFKN